MRTATPEQKNILFAFGDLAEKENEISQKINRIYTSADKGGIYYDGAGVTLCETEEDARIISAKLREDLVTTRSQIADHLKKAVDELNMGNVGIIQRQYPNYVK